MDFKIILSVINILFLVYVSNSQSNEESKEIKPPSILALKDKIKKCKSLELTSIETDKEATTLKPLSTEEIHKICNKSSQYETYLSCVKTHEDLQKVSVDEIKLNRLKRSTCDDECDDNDEDCEGSCVNTCNTCYNCDSCNSCSKCTTNSCCQNQCNRQCRSSSCRRACKSDCYSRVIENNKKIIVDVVNNITGDYNVTTIIKLNNLINTSNVVDIPIKVNTTNLNNITIEPSLPNVPQVPEASGYGPCCHIEFPRECTEINEYPYKRCFHRRRRICGPQCVAPASSPPTPVPQPPIYYPPILPPMYPPLMPFMPYSQCMPPVSQQTSCGSCNGGGVNILPYYNPYFNPYYGYFGNSYYANSNPDSNAAASQNAAPSTFSYLQAGVGAQPTQGSYLYQKHQINPTAIASP